MIKRMNKIMTYENVSAGILLAIVLILLAHKLFFTGDSSNRNPASANKEYYDRGDFDHSPYDDHGGTIQY